MHRYSANYAHTDHNLVIQQLPEGTCDQPYAATYCVLANLLHRGAPTRMSHRLRAVARLEDNYYEQPAFVKTRRLVPTAAAQWVNLIRGGDTIGYYPAQELFEQLPTLIPEYPFLQSLLRPEVPINEITGVDSAPFRRQAVDFYLAEAKLVLELDGIQHTAAEAQRKDDARDRHLLRSEVTTIRIPTAEWRSPAGKIAAAARIKAHLDGHAEALRVYQVDEAQKADAIKYAYLPTAILRIQTVAIELLRRGIWQSGATAQLCVRRDETEAWLTAQYISEAIEDCFDFIERLFALQADIVWQRSMVKVEVLSNFSGAKAADETRLDFSIFNRWSHPNALRPDCLYCRNDYNQQADFYRLQTAPCIQYRVTEARLAPLEWLLHNLFDLKSLRPGQFPIISSALNGEDTIGLLPTGGGKSLCYQLPCLLQPTTSYVVAPIISLMEDQVRTVRGHMISRIESINSQKSEKEKTEVITAYGAGRYHWIYISPERFQIQGFRDLFSQVIADAPPAIGVIDEVHCLSEWGHDFRVSYLTLIRTIHKFTPTTKLLGLTATASVNVLQDLKAEFSHGRKHFGAYNVKSQLDFSRKELVFEVVKATNQEEELHERLQKNELPTLVFAPHVNGAKGVFPIAKRIQAQLGVKADWYAGSSPSYRFEEENPIWHKMDAAARELWLDQRFTELGFSGNEKARLSTNPNDYAFKSGKVKARTKVDILSNDEINAHKESVQDRFIQDDVRVLVATKAFGMGIDKPNIHNTFHFGLPAGVEALYQEAGRAGRGDNFRREIAPDRAKCTVLYQAETDDTKSQLAQLITKDGNVEKTQEFIETLRHIEKADQTTQLSLSLRGLLTISDQVLTIIELFAWKGPKSKEFTPTDLRPRALWTRCLETESSYKARGSDDDQLAQIAQVAVYRLGILGLVDDWTVNYAAAGIHSIVICWRAADAKAIRAGLLHYLRRYDKTNDFESELGDYTGLTVQQVLAKAADYLVRWTARNITYNRLKALQTLVEFCDPFTDSETFKAQLDSYFRVSDRTVVLQHLRDFPFDVVRWQEVFWQYKDTPNNKELPTPRESIFSLPALALQNQLKDIQGGLRRFLESADNVPGINLVSGLTQLALDDFDHHPDGRPRFRRALEALRDNPGFGEGAQTVVEQLLELVFDALPAEQRYPAIEDTLQILRNLTVDYVDRYDLLELATDRIADRRQTLAAELDRLLSFRLTTTPAHAPARNQLEARLAEVEREREHLLAEIRLTTPDVR